MANELLNELTSEAAERWAELTVTKAIAESRASNRGLVASISHLFTSSLDPSSTFRVEGVAKASAMGRVTEYVPVLAATALGTIFRKASFWAKILPGDNSPFVLALKRWAPMVVPGLIIGTGEAIADSVRNAMVSIEPQIQAESVGIDDLVWWPQIPGVVFVPQRAEGGLIRYQDSATQCFPAVIGAIPDSPDAVARYYRESTDWLLAHTTSRQVNEPGGGKQKKGQPQPQGQTHTLTTVPTRPIVFIKREDIPRLVRDHITPAQADALMNMFRQKEWTARVGSTVLDFFIYLGRSMRQGGALLYDIREDFLKDIVGHNGIAMLQKLANYYNPRRDMATDRFSMDDMDDIMATIDAFMGAELTWADRAKRTVARLWANRIKVNVPAKVRFIAWMTLAGVAFATIALFMLFIGCFWMVIKGAFSPCDEPIQYIWWTFDGRWGAVVLMGIGGAVMTVLMFLLRPLQTAINLLAFWVPAPKSNALPEFGYKFTFMLGVAFSIAMGILLFGSPVTWRVAVLLLSFIAISIGMGYKAADNPEEARLLAFRGAQYGWLVTLGILFLNWLCRGAPDFAGISVFHRVPELFHKDVQDWIKEHWFLAIVLISTVLVLPCALFGWMLSKLKKELWVVALIVWICLTIAIGHDRYTTAKEAASTPTPVAAKMTVAPAHVAPTPVVAASAAPAPLVTTKVIYRRAGVGHGGGGHNHSMSAEECAQFHSFEGRQEAGCN